MTEVREEVNEGWRDGEKLKTVRELGVAEANKIGRGEKVPFNANDLELDLMGTERQRKNQVKGNIAQA